MNRSINETLPRSVMTHATVLATALALLVFAGPILRPFAWIMTFGVITATFTSIYVSGGLLLWINHTWPLHPRDKTSVLAPAATLPSAEPQRSSARR